MRNKKKKFNGKEVSLEDTLQLALIEMESWKSANQKGKEDDDVEVQNQSPMGEIAIISPNPICQIDALCMDRQKTGKWIRVVSCGQLNVISHRAQRI